MPLSFMVLDEAPTSLNNFLPISLSIEQSIGWFVSPSTDLSVTGDN